MSAAEKIEDQYLITAPEAAKLLRVCRNTFEKNVRPHIRVMKIGKCVRFYREEVLAWAERQGDGPSVGEAYSPRFESRTRASAPSMGSVVTLSPRAKEILKELEKPPRISTRRLFPVGTGGI